MTLNNLTDALAAYDIAVPRVALPWLEVRAAALSDHDAATIQTLDELLDNGLTAADVTDAVQRVTRQRLEVETRRVVDRQLAEGAAARAARAIQSEAEAIITTARTRFNVAARTIAANAATYPADASAEDVLSRGPEVVEAWSQIRQASTDLDLAAHLWSTLYGRPPVVDAVVKTYDGDHWRRVDGAALFDGESRWHALVAAGYSLRLNTYQEAMALVSATPERTLRAEASRNDGFIGTALVRS